MNWLRKNNPFEDDRDRHAAPSRAMSMAPQRGRGSEDYEAPQIFRTYSASSRPTADPAQGQARYNNNGQRCDEKLFRTASNTYDFNAVTTAPVTEDQELEKPEASEETLVALRGALVHLVGDAESPLLAEGAFEVVRVEQSGNCIVVFVRVGEQLRWPLTRDEPAVKLDSSHYFFTIRVPRPVDDMDRDTAGGHGDEMLSYGVTFPVAGQEPQLRELDSVLEQYSNFSAPQLVQGDRQQIVPEEVVSSEGKQVTKGSQAEFWKTMAPNVDDYNSKLARSMAKGTGNVIRGIFRVRDSTVARLESGSIYVKGRVKPNSKPSNISPQTLRNLKRVQNMSIATEQVAKNVLEGVVKTVGFFSGAMMKSKAGKKFFKLLPGEVALVSMDAFAKVFDALEKAGSDVMQSTAMFTQDVVTHRYGEDAGQVTENTLSTAGHVFATAWTVSKVRRALNPSKFRPSKTGMLKAAAKAAVGGRSK
jgi:spartin